MVNFGYTLMTEQSGPKELVRYAIAAEQVGFDFEVSSDHYSPWLTSQGHAPYAWTVLGAVAQATERVERILTPNFLASFSTARAPALCRVYSYLVPGLPRPTTSQADSAEDMTWSLEELNLEKGGVTGSSLRERPPKP